MLAQKTIDLTVSRLVNAGQEDVFDAWFDYQYPGSPWYGVLKASVDPREDGLFYHSVQSDERELAHYGRFVILDRPMKIQQTWVSEATRGLESMVTLTFEDRGDRTLVKLIHSNLPDDEMGLQHEQAWGFVLGSLAQRFATKKVL